MKNILLATQSLGIGGVETHILELCKGIKEANKDINLIVCSNGGRYEEELKKINVKHIKVPLHNSNPINIIKSYFLLNKIIKEEKIDIVHSHTRTASMILEKICSKNNIPFYTTCHFDYSLKFPFKNLSTWGNKTLAVSKDLKEYLVRNYDLNPEDIFVTVNGIDMNLFCKETKFDDILEKFNLRKDSFRIVHISRLDDATIKTLDILFDLTKEINEKIENLEIVVVGNGTKFEYLKERASKINESLNKNIIVMLRKYDK